MEARLKAVVEQECERADIPESLCGKYEVLWGGGVEKAYEKYRDIVKERTNDVCGVRCVGGKRGKGSEWCSEVTMAVAVNRRAFEEWWQSSSGVSKEMWY